MGLELRSVATVRPYPDLERVAISEPAGLAFARELRAAAGGRSAQARRAGVARRASQPERARAGRLRLRRAALAEAVGTRPRPPPAAPHRGRAEASQGPEAHQ